MREYMDDQRTQLKVVTCNKCGKQILIKNDILQEDVFQAEKVWGYFSQKDGKKHTWDLCEACYEQIVRGFVIPLEEMEVTELL